MKLNNRLQKYFLRFLIVTIFSVTLFQTGCSENSTEPTLGGVTGEIILKNELSGTNSPISGIKVYLIDKDFIVDTVNYENNKAAILDSAITDEKGVYTIGNIKNGNYAVTPIPGNGEYKFSHNTSSDSYLFSINEEKKNYSISFFSTDPSMFDAGKFTLNIINKNLPISPYPFETWYFYVYWDRVEILVFIPVGKGGEYTFFDGPVTDQDPPYVATPVVLQIPYGYSYIFYTLTNNIRLEFQQLTDAQKTVNKFEGYLNYNLGNVPPLITVEADWATNTMKVL